MQSEKLDTLHVEYVKENMQKIKEELKRAKEELAKNMINNVSCKCWKLSCHRYQL
jgi:hypothetical protein